MKTVYIAGLFESRARLRGCKDALESMGYKVLSSWLDETRPRSLVTELEIIDLVSRDLKEIVAADVFILDTIDEDRFGGREVEFGVAGGMVKHGELYRVGPQRNIFHNIVDKAFDSWDWCLAYLDERGQNT